MTSPVMSRRWSQSFNLFATDLTYEIKRCDSLLSLPVSQWLYYHHNILYFLEYTTPLTLISSVEFSSVAQSCPTLCNPMNRSTPGLPVHYQLPESLRLTSIESVMPSSHLILGCPLLLLPPIPPSIKVSSNDQLFV